MPPLSFLHRDKASDPYAPLNAILRDKKFWSQFRTALNEALTPVLREVFLAGAVAAQKIKPRTAAGKTAKASKAAPLPAADLTPDEFITQFGLDTIAEDAIKRYMNTFIRGISDTTYNTLRDIIIRARRDGAALESIIGSAQALFSPERAQTIAVTETTRLFGLGAQAAYEARGITGWQWRTVNDDWVDEDCADLDGTNYDISEEFEPAHPNCRCFNAPVML